MASNETIHGTQAASTQTEPLSASSDVAMPKILVADDDRTTRLILVRLFERAGYEIVVADDGQQALERFYAEKADIVLLDVMMPRKSGHEVCEQNLSDGRFADVPILFLSARDTPQDKIIGLELGAVDYITKPYNRAEVLVRVRNQARIQKLARSLREAHDDLVAEQKCLDEDLKAAGNIQRSLIPKEPPPIPGVEAGGPLIGLGNILPFDEGEVQFHTGDRLFIYTDGIVESVNPDNEFFNEEGLDQAVLESATEDLEGAVKYIRGKIEDFAGSASQPDDISLLGLHFQYLDS